MSEGRRALILLVEDEAMVRWNATEILQDAGYQVLEARDGVEAIAALESHARQVSALLTDVRMPNMNGLALARTVHDRWPHIGVVITTAALPTGLDLDLTKGARFLPKPYSLTALLQQIEAVLPRVGGPITIKSIPTLLPGREFGAGGIAHPLPEPDDS